MQAYNLIQKMKNHSNQQKALNQKLTLKAPQRQVIVARLQKGSVKDARRNRPKQYK